MNGLPLRKLLTLLMIVGVCHAGLVHRRAAEETLNQESESVPSAPRIDKIPVTIIQEPEQEPLATAAVTSAPIKLPIETSSIQPAAIEGAKIDENNVQNVQQKAQPQLVETAPVVPALQAANIIAENVELQPSLEVQSSSVELQSDAVPAHSVQSQQLDSSTQSQLSEEQPLSIITESVALLEADDSIKALVSPESIGEQQETGVPSAEVSAAEVAVASVDKDELQRQATQPTPTQTSTQQNFVQQLIQNSPIGQFLSQFTGGQQQQPGQQLADEPITPAPTLPGFLNPGAAITSAQQAVQNAAQSVVNTTTQAFQGLQQFATNLGTQFQNTFSTLAGQQNQLSTADSTTTRPPGPIQSIVSNFVNPANNQGTEGVTAAPGQQGPQQQGPLQGILNFLQGGNRPQAANAIGAVPPKEEPITPAGVDDKIEPQQNDAASAIVPDQQEPDTANEVRSSAEVTNEDTSFEDGQGEDLIVVHDDATQQDVQS